MRTLILALALLLITPTMSRADSPSDPSPGPMKPRLKHHATNPRGWLAVAYNPLSNDPHAFLVHAFAHGFTDDDVSIAQAQDLLKALPETPCATCDALREALTTYIEASVSRRSSLAHGAPRTLWDPVLDPATRDQTLQALLDRYAASAIKGLSLSPAQQKTLRAPLSAAPPCALRVTL